MKDDWPEFFFTIFAVILYFGGLMAFAVYIDRLYP